MNKILIRSVLLITIFSGCQNKVPTAQVNSNPPNNLSLSYDQSKILVAGQCSPKQDLKILDIYGKQTPAVTDQTIHLSSSVPAVKFFSDQNCNNEITVLKVKAGASSSEFYIQDSISGYFSYSATTSNISADSQSHISVSPNATQITFTGPTDFEAGVCSPAFTVTTRNYTEVASNVTEDTQIDFSNVGLGKIYLTSNCSDAGGVMAFVKSGNSSVDVYFKSPKVGGYNIIVTAPGPVLANTYSQIKAGVPNKMTFLTGPQTVSAGVCSGTYTFQYQDAFGNPTSFSSDTPVNLSGDSLKFYSDPACLNSSTSTITVPSNNTTSNFYILANKTTSNSLKISGVGVDQFQSVTVSPGVASKIYLQPLTSAITAGAPFERINVQAQDQYGNYVSGFNRLYSLAAYTDSACSNLSTTSLNGISQVATNSIASFIGINYTKAGVTYLGVTSVGLTPACSAQIVVNPDFASKLNLTSLASFKVGECSSAFVIKTTDQYSNQTTTGTSANIGLSGSGSGQFYSTPDCSGSSITQVIFPANTPSVNFYAKDLTVEGLMLSVSGIGSTPGTFPVSVIAGDPVKIAFYSPAGMTSGQCTGGFTVKLLDNYDNGSTSLTNLTVSLSQNGNSMFFTDSTCLNSVTSLTISKGSSSKQFFAKDAVAETLRVDVQSLSYDYKILTVSPAVAKQLSFISTPTSATAVTVFSIVKVGIQDSNGNLLGNSTNSITLSAYSDPFCSKTAPAQIGGTKTQSAVSSVASFSDVTYSVSSNLYLGASSIGLASACSPLIQITPSSAAQLLLSSSLLSPIVGNCIPIDVKTTDNQGNLSPVIVDSLIDLKTTSQGTFYGSSDCSGSIITSVQINQNTSLSKAYFKDNKAESTLISGSNSGLVPSSLSITVKESLPVKLSVAGSTNIVGGKCSPYSIQALDSFNNLSKVSSAVSVTLGSTGSGTFFSDSNCTTQTSLIILLDATNSTTVYVKDSILELINLTASSATLSSMTLSGVIVAAGTPTKLIINGPGILTTGSCTTYQINSLDDYGNPANVSADSTIVLADYSFGKFYTSADCSGVEISSVIIPSHLNKVVVSFMDVRAEGITFSASNSALGIATQTVVINPSAAGKIVFNSAAKTVTAGICTTSIELKLTDNTGNFVNALSNVAINLADPSVQYYSQAGCGGSEITSTQIAQGSSGVSIYAVVKKTSVTSLSLSSFYGLMNQSITVSADITAKVSFTQVPKFGIPGSNSFSIPIIVQSSDRYGNPNTFYSGNVSIASFKDSSCSSPTINSIIGVIQQQFAGGTASFNGIGYSQAETIYIKASSAGIATSCSSSIIVSSSNPTKINLSGLASITAGECSGPFTAAAQDSFNNLANVSSLTPINFSGLGSGGSIHSTSACVDGTTNSIINMAANTNTKIIYVKGMTANSYILEGLSTFGSVKLPYTITPATASVLLIAGPKSVYSGSCNKYSITAQDAYSNSVILTQNYLLPLTGKSAGDFYSDSLCSTVVSSVTIPSSSSSTNFYFKDNTIGDPASLSSNYSGFISPGIAVSVLSLQPSKITISGAGSITVGNCSPYVLSLLNSSNQAAASMSPTTVALSGVSSGLFFSDSACATSVSSTIIDPGLANKTLYFKDGSPESVILNVAASGMSGGVFPVTINTGLPTSIVFNVQPQATTIAGNNLNSISVYYIDQYNNLVFSGNPIVMSVLNSDLSTGPAVIGTNSVIPDSVTGYTVFTGLSVQKSGSFILKASGSSISGKSSSIVITPAAVSALIKISGDSQVGRFSSPLDLPLVVAAKDQYGNFVPNVSIRFDPQTSSGTFSPTSAILSGINGQASASFIAGSTVSGLLPLKSYVTTNLSIFVLFSETIVGVKSLGLDGPISVVRNVCSGPFIVKSLDQNDNAINTTVNVTTSLTSTEPGVSFYSDSGCSAASPSPVIAAGTNSTQFYINNTSTNGFTITAASNDITSGAKTESTQAVRFSTTAINYGTTNANQDATLTIINDGSSLYIPSISYSGGGFGSSYFQVISDGCSNITVFQGSTCAVSIRFLAGNCGTPNGVNTSGSIDLPSLGLSASVYGNTSYNWVETAVYGYALTGFRTLNSASGACSAKCQIYDWDEGGDLKGPASCGATSCGHRETCL